MQDKADMLAFPQECVDFQSGEWGLETNYHLPQFPDLQQIQKEFKLHTVYLEISEQINPLQLVGQVESKF